MNIVYNVMVFLHIVGAAMIVGIWIGHMKKPDRPPPPVRRRALQLITGIVMMGSSPCWTWTPTTSSWASSSQSRWRRRPGLHRPPSSSRRANRLRHGIAHGVGGLALLNVAIATLWQ